MVESSTSKAMFEHLDKYPLFGVTLPTDSGIYAIVNKVNDEFYIGSTKNQFGFRGRFGVHRHKFITKTHTQKLNEVYAEYGPDNLEIWIILLCPDEECHQYEQLFINLLEPHYNGKKTVGSWTGFKHTDQTRQVIREKAILRGARSDSTKKKLSDAKGKPFELYHEIDGVIRGVNLKAFEKGKGLKRGMLGRLIRGQSLYYEGYSKDKESQALWFAQQEEKERARQEKANKPRLPRKPGSSHRQKAFSFYVPGVGTITGINVRAYARDNEFDFRGLYAVLDGRHTQYENHYKNEESYLASVSRKLQQSSVHAGVKYVAKENKWRVDIWVPNLKKQVYKGSFKTETEAAQRAYDARIELGLDIA